MANRQTEILESQLIKLALSPYRGCRRLFVAYSGGVDSHVLLHLCAQQNALKSKLTAVYVHHGLQDSADYWAEHCRKTASLLTVEFQELRVDARPVNGQSPEEAARNARYGALSALLDTQDLLLVAQHREDQLETVLLQLFRGAGLQGLTGMPAAMSLGKGVLLRPLLNISKQDIQAYAERYALNWVEDPSNQSDEFDRNFLRNDVLPLLKKRWPALDKTVSRAAAHCAEAQGLIREAGADLLEQYLNKQDQTLSLLHWERHDCARQALLLRSWFAFLGMKMPSQRLIHQIIHEVVGASETAQPEVVTQGRVLRRFRNRLYCVAVNAYQLPESTCFEWDGREDSLILTQRVKLQRVKSSSGISIASWSAAKVTVGFRRGGERISLPGREGRHSLKNLFQEASIPPWERQVVPLIYLDGRLAAVADRWISSEFYEQEPHACYQINLINDALI